MAQSASDRESDALFMRAVPHFFYESDRPVLATKGSLAPNRSKHGFKPPELNEFEEEIVSAWGNDGFLVNSALVRWLAAGAEANDRTDAAEYIEWSEALKTLSLELGERKFSPLSAALAFRRWFEERGLAT